jgi:hypothetical protein
MGAYKDMHVGYEVVELWRLCNAEVVGVSKDMQRGGTSDVLRCSEIAIDKVGIAWLQSAYALFSEHLPTLVVTSNIC